MKASEKGIPGAPSRGDEFSFNLPDTIRMFDNEALPLEWTNSSNTESINLQLLTDKKTQLLDLDINGNMFWFNNIGTFFKCFLLDVPCGTIATPVHRNRTNSQEIGEAFNLLIDLLREFARGCNHQCIQMPCFSMNDIVENRKYVRSGFPGSGLRTCNEIFLFKDNRNSLFLNRCWLSVAHG